MADKRAYEAPVIRDILPGSEEYMQVVKLMKEKIQEEDDEILKQFVERRK